MCCSLYSITKNQCFFFFKPISLNSCGLCFYKPLVALSCTFFCFELPKYASLKCPVWRLPLLKVTYVVTTWATLSLRKLELGGVVGVAWVLLQALVWGQQESILSVKYFQCKIEKEIEMHRSGVLCPEEPLQIPKPVTERMSSSFDAFIVRDHNWE